MTPQDTMRLALDWLDNNGGAHIADELRASLAQQCEPVAIRYDFDGYGWRYIDSGSGSNWCEKVTHLDAEPLYAGAAPAVLEAVEKLERDAACLDWLDATGKNKVLSLCDRWYTRADYGQPYRKHKNLREAIDAAMEATNGQGN